MNMYSKTLVTISLFFVVSLTQAAEGLYIGFNLGQASTDVSLSDIDDGSFTSGSVEDSDTSISIMIGKKFTPNFAVEGGYIDLGELSIDAVSDGSVFWAAGPVSAKLEATGFFIGAKGLMPLNKTSSLYGKAGLLRWDIDLALSDSAGGISFSDSGSDIYFGFGVSFAINDSVSLGVDYTSYDIDGDDTGVISVGVQLEL